MNPENTVKAESTIVHVPFWVVALVLGIFTDEICVAAIFRCIDTWRLMSRTAFQKLHRHFQIIPDIAFYITPFNGQLLRSCFAR